MTIMRTILAPVDFSVGSEAALEHARDLAEMYDSDLHLLHVTDTSVIPAWARELFGPQLRPVAAEHGSTARDRLAMMVASHHLNPRRTKIEVRVGCAEQTIADYADQLHADLIVMGVHGEGHVPHTPLGQVLERVLARARCPVLTIPEEALETVRVPAPVLLREQVAC
jgi:nucleotide-binding universal stress UspA family protein